MCGNSVLTCSIWNRFDPRPSRVCYLESRISCRVSHFRVPRTASCFCEGRRIGLGALSPYAPGTEIILTLEAPADGYVAIFHGCEETGEVKLVFPLYATDNPRVLRRPGNPSHRRNCRGASGEALVQGILDKRPAARLKQVDVQNEEQYDRALDDFLDSLEHLKEDDWRVVTHENQVLSE